MSFLKTFVLASVSIGLAGVFSPSDAQAAQYLNPNVTAGDIVGPANYSPAPSDPAVSPSFTYFVGNNPANPSYALYYEGGPNPEITAGTYEVSISWATGADRLVPATFRVDVNGDLAFETNVTVDQTKLADGVTTGAANQWSGFKSLGNFVLGDGPAFAWDYSTAPNNNGVLTAGTIRLTAAVVPEPATAAIGAVVAMGLGLRRRRAL